MRKSWKTLVAAVVVAGGASSGAVADGYDYEYEPVGKSFAAPAKVFSWTGFYVGGHVGAGWGDVSGTNDSNDGGWGFNIDPNKAFGGVQTGYNYQTGQFVFGIEADYSWLNNYALVTGQAAFDPSLPETLTAKMDDLASIRGRLGWAWQNIMAYGTVGWGWARYEFSGRDPGIVPPSGKISFNENGIVYGGGLEIGLTNAVLVRAEYLRYDVGTSASTTGRIPDADPGDFVKFDDIDVVRGAISFKFN